MNGRVLLHLLALAVVSLVSCDQRRPEPRIEPSTRSGAGVTPSPNRRPSPAATFSDITVQAGITFRHENGASGGKWMPETMGSGCAVLDFDGDGLPDLLFVNGTVWPGREQAGPPATPRLYRNRGDGTFEDVTARAGLSFSTYGMGAAAGDYDADGDPDLYLTAVGDNRLLRNDGSTALTTGGGVFTDVTDRAGVAGSRWKGEDGKTHPEWSTSAAWADVDGDGWIDLFVCHYVQWSPDTDLFTTIDGVNKSYATPQQYPGSTCRLYRNRGDGTFEEVTQRSGVYSPNGKSLGVALADFDDDGGVDLVVANDTQPTFLYRNQGNGTFKEVGLTSGVAYDEEGRARAGMGVDVASPDNDRALAIAIGNFSREGVSLYRQAVGDAFEDEARGRGLVQPTLPSLTFGLLFFDSDLDGYQDLALANGHIEPEVQKVQRDLLYEQRPQLFRNDRERRFEEVTDRSGGAFARRVVGRGLATGDLDGDGDPDLVVTTNGGAPVVMRNDGPTGRAIRVRLRGAHPNRDALGAVVTATAGDLEQRATVRTGSSYLSQSETTLTFGLETRPRVDRLSIRWPGGRTEVSENLEAGFTYEIEQGRGTVRRIPFVRRTP